MLSLLCFSFSPSLVGMILLHPPRLLLCSSSSSTEKTSSHLPVCDHENMTQPTCGYNCIELIIAEDPCNYNTKCLCLSSSYILKFRTCLSIYCDAVSSQQWIALGEANCASVGVTFSTTASITPALGASVTSALGAKTTSVNGQAATVTVAGFPFGINTGASASVVGIQPVTSTTSSSAQPTQDSKGGLGAGAIIGIAVGAVVLVLLAILAAFLIWRKRRKQPKNNLQETLRAPVLEANSPQPDTGKEVKAGTITNVLYSPQYSAEQDKDPARYDVKPLVSNVSGDTQYHPQQLNSAPAEYLHSGNPLYTRAELIGMSTSEAAPSTRAPNNYGPSHPGAIEADSAHPNYVTSPVSEVESNPSGWHQELSASNYETPYSTATGYPTVAAQELSPFPAATPVINPASYASTASNGRPGTHEEQNAKLDRMKVEIEAVRAEKERVLHLKALEERERELSRNIVNMELAKGSGS